MPMKPVFKVSAAFAVCAGLGVIDSVAPAPAQALVVSFQNVQFVDDFSQNQGTGTIFGTVNFSNYLTGPSNAKVANVGTLFNCTSSCSAGTFNLSFNSFYIDATNTNELWFFNNPIAGTPPSSSSSTYQMNVRFSANITGDSVFDNPLNIVAAPGNASFICNNVATGDIGTNNCNKGETNRVDFATGGLSGGLVPVPSPVSALALLPIVGLSGLRKRYKSHTRQLSDVQPKLLASSSNLDQSVAITGSSDSLSISSYPIAFQCESKFVEHVNQNQRYGTCTETVNQGSARSAREPGCQIGSKD